MPSHGTSHDAGPITYLEVMPGLTVRIEAGNEAAPVETARLPGGLFVAAVLDGACRLTVERKEGGDTAIIGANTLVVATSEAALDCAWRWCPAHTRRLVAVTFCADLIADGAACTGQPFCGRGAVSLRTMPLPQRIGVAAEHLLKVNAEGGLRACEAALRLSLFALDAAGATGECCCLERDRRRIAQAREMLEADPRRAWTISALARSVGINERKLKAGFRVHFGTTVKGAVTQARLRAGYALIANGQAGITDAARSVGYAKPRHFAELFRRHYGLAPAKMQPPT